MRYYTCFSLTDLAFSTWGLDSPLLCLMASVSIPEPAFIGWIGLRLLRPPSASRGSGWTQFSVFEETSLSGTSRTDDSLRKFERGGNYFNKMLQYRGFKCCKTTWVSYPLWLYLAAGPLNSALHPGQTLDHLHPPAPPCLHHHIHALSLSWFAVSWVALWFQQTELCILIP